LNSRALLLVFDHGLFLRQVPKKQFAARHGKRRKKDRYTPSMLVREFQLIGETIYDLLGTDMLPLGTVELTSDLRLLTQSVNTFTLKSFEAYSRAR
jgi:hypothetical protein